MLQIDEGESLLVLVKLHTPSRRMHDRETLPTIVCNLIELFQLMHQYDVGYDVRKVPDLHSTVSSNLVSDHSSRIAVDLDTPRC